MQSEDPREALAALVPLIRDERARVLATLVRTTGSLAVAEDAVQDATLRALERWPLDGIPAEPRAWLTLVARRRALDVLRRESHRQGKELAADAVLVLGRPDEVPAPETVRDDLLRLLFTCCHPALDLQTQSALALATLTGLDNAQIGRALLTGEAAMAKRLTRARRKILVAGIPYRVPPPKELPTRLRGVLLTVYLLFNEGYCSTGGADPQRIDLAAEAVRLARLLVELLPDEPGAVGLLALLLLTHARSPARLDHLGSPVRLQEQDRDRWDRLAVTEGVTLIGRGFELARDRADPYLTQAVIAACHDLAPTYADTDWRVILSWYDVLLTVADTPVSRLNRAIALTELRGADAGLAELDSLPQLVGYPLWHIARADALQRLGRTAEADLAREQALALPMSDAVRIQVSADLADAGTRGQWATGA